MSDLLPIFPLPNVVLFPNVFLPLHIFEPRYREMVTDALAGDRLIGMVLLRPGWERDYEGRPPVFPIGCRGLITHVERLADGRFNIVLRGLDRFRIVAEDQERGYRRATTDMLDERALGEEDRAVVRRQRSKLEAMLAPAERAGQGQAGASHAPELTADPKIPPGMPDDELVNALAQYLDLEPLEKQALLEQPSLRERAESLVELLEMKILIARHPSVTHLSH